MKTFSVSGNIVDVVNRKIFPGIITVENGIITQIEDSSNVPNCYILPGFIDAHIHIESSMLIPSEFARLAVPHGTIATVSDPHEIGNVLGINGVRYMIENGKQVPFHFFFGAPSCVPATAFETAGATITNEEIYTLFTEDKLLYLSEMMNYPGVLHRDPLVMDKINTAHSLGLPVDGHAPGLKGDEAKRYASAGITTDHECFSLEEALDKIDYGMKISIREGSAAKNYNALHSLLASHPEKVMFCSDDKHPHELVKGHINLLVKRSIVEHGYDTMDVLRAACYNPVIHYKLDTGLLQKTHSADFIVVDNLIDFTVQKTFIRGSLVAEKGVTYIESQTSKILNHFNVALQKIEDFKVAATTTQLDVIHAIDGELITKKFKAAALLKEGFLISNPEQDILKLVVVNRYNQAPPAIAFIKGFGIKKGAIASCIAHDSHNIIAVGVDDHDICNAINAIIENKGGISTSIEGNTSVLPLVVAGIMSNADGFTVAKQYAELDNKAKELGSSLEAPFMTLSFMALLVIPSLKLSDKGLFDSEKFCFVKPLI